MYHSVLIAVNAINLAVLSLLLYVYARNYANIRSKFNLGLLLFSLLFFVENALILHLGIFQWPAIASEIIVMHMLVINIIQMLGLLVLLYVTWK